MNETQLKKLKKSFFVENKELEKLEETHISWLFFTKKKVYKIKKPVRFSFLDFSKPEYRKYYCEKEVDLNKRLSPEIYLGVTTINSYKGKLIINGKGKVIDYAVVMKRLPDKKRLDVLLKEDMVSKKMIQSIAEKIFLFHKKAEIISQGRWARPLHLKYLFNDISTVKTVVSKHLKDEKIIDFLIKKSNSFIEKNKQLILERKRNGFVRDCHMDLHSENIFYVDKPFMIDCVEFSHDFRYGDVCSDVAFFCMDLEAKNHEKLSKHFLKKYLELSKDESLKKVFSWYMAYRANTRAKINALTLAQQKNKEKTAKYKDKTKKYLDLTKKYCEKL